MPLVAECPQCGRKGNVPDQYRGRQAKCPGCANRFTIGAPVAATVPIPSEAAPESTPANGTPAPSPVATIVAECPECGFTGRVPERAKGLKVQCRKCGESFLVGAPPPAPPVSVAEESDGPAAKLMDGRPPAAEDGVPEEMDLAPLEESNPPGETVVAAGTDLDTVEEAEIVEEGEVVAEEPAPPKRGSHPGTHAPEPPAMWTDLDGPVKKQPAVRVDRGRTEEKEAGEKSKVAMVVAAAGGGIACLLLLALVLFLVVGGKQDKTKVASVASRPTPPVV